MRHTEHVIIGNLSYSVPKHVVREVEELLKKAKAKALQEFEDKDSIPAHVLFPVIDDPFRGPALSLKVLRKRHKLTQAQLANKAGIKQSHISEMERCKRPIGKAVAKKLAATLNSNWRDLISG